MWFNDPTNTFTKSEISLTTKIINALELHLSCINPSKWFTTWVLNKNGRHLSDEICTWLLFRNLIYFNIWKLNVIKIRVSKDCTTETFNIIHTQIAPKLWRVYYLWWQTLTFSSGSNRYYFLWQCCPESLRSALVSQAEANWLPKPTGWISVIRCNSSV